MEIFNSLKTGLIDSKFGLLFLGILSFWSAMTVRFTFFNDKPFIDQDNLIVNDSFSSIKNSLFTGMMYINFDSGISEAYKYFENSNFFKMCFWFTFMMLNKFFIQKFGLNTLVSFFSNTMTKYSDLFEEYPKTARALAYWYQFRYIRF